VPASKRRDKQRRQARHAADSARSERRRAEAAAARAVADEVESRMNVVLSDDHSPEEAAEMLATLFPDDASRCLRMPLAAYIVGRGSPERARDVAAAALARAPEGVVELQLAAQAAWILEGDGAAAAALYEEAARHAEGEALRVVRIDLAGMLLAAERGADAARAVLPACSEEPLDDEAQATLAAALELAARRVAAGEEASAEAEVLRQFEDPSPFEDLRVAVRVFVDAEGLRDHITGHCARWWRESELSELPVGDDRMDEHRERLDAFAVECALLLRPGSAAALGTDPGQQVDDEDPELERRQSVLGRFAAHPGTTEERARRAGDWLVDCRYGLWRVDDPVPSPGVWVVDLLSGRRVYAAFTAQQVAGLARRSVLLGMLLPVDGVWRPSGSLLAVRPAEGDELAEEVVWMAQVVAEDLEGETAGRRPRRRSRRPAAASVSRSVVVDLDRPSSPAAADLYSKITAQIFPSLYGMVVARRLAAPRTTNTDGEPIVEITAAVAVGDLAATWQALEHHADFEVEHEDDASAGRKATLAWWGRTLSAAEQATMAEEARTRLEAQGGDPDSLDLTRPARWLRGRVRRGDGELVLEVNSEGRLARLLGLLGEVGAAPVLQVADRAPIRHELRSRLRGVDLGAAGFASAAAAHAWAEAWLA
jgi:hypothetical protein